MPDFIKIPAPVAHPTTCWSCHTHADKNGFADRAVEILHYGRVYTCSQCAKDMARLFGMVPPEIHAAKCEELSEARAAIEALEKQLEAEKADKVVPLGEVVDFVNAHFEKRGYKPGEKPKPRAAA